MVDGDISQAAKTALRNFEPVFRAAVTSLSPDPHLREALLYATAGGKRVRALMMLELATIMGVDTTQTLVPAVAVEMIHAYSLVHDDLPAMDDDDLRRGRPTVHIRFDEATAILVGDALQAGAFATIADAPGVSAELRVRWLSRLAGAAGAQGMVLGQLRDIAAERRRDMPMEDLRDIQRLKTGAIFGFCCLAVADLHPESGPVLSMMEDFSCKLGELFQLSDDIIGATVRAEISGKTAGSDARHGKSTMVQAWGLAAAQARADDLAEETLAQLDRVARITGYADVRRSLLADVLRWLPRRQY